MRNLLAAIVILTVGVFASGEARAFDSLRVDARITQLQNSLENQIDRLKLAREQAGTEMSLARIRVAEELRRSQENLQIQVEALARLKEQLSEQGASSSEALDQLKSDWSQRLGSDFSSIETQLAQTNDLISRMESLRQSFDPDTATTSDVAVGPLTLTTTPFPTEAAPPALTQPETVPPMIPTVSIAPPETVQPMTPTVSTPPLGGG